MYLKNSIETEAVFTKKEMATAQSAGTVKYTHCIAAKGLDFPYNERSGYDSLGALGNLEYCFIAIAPKSTLAQNSSTW